jgi:hypothetical protein
VNDKNVGMHDHILIEQIHEVAVISFFDTAVAMTMQADKQGERECCKLILPTTGKQLNH